MPDAQKFAQYQTSFVCTDFTINNLADIQQLSMLEVGYNPCNLNCINSLQA